MTYKTAVEQVNSEKNIIDNNNYNIYDSIKAVTLYNMTINICYKPTVQQTYKFTAMTQLLYYIMINDSLHSKYI